MRRAWVLAVLVLAACGAAGEGAGHPVASSSSPPERRTRRVRPLEGSETTVAAGELACEAPPDTRAADERLPKGARVVGRVLDARGEPVDGAEVVAFLGVTKVEGTADREGAFSLAIDEPTGVVRCLAWDEGRSIAVGDWFALRAGERTDVGTLRCGDAAPIDGWIAAADGTRTHGVVSVEWTNAFDAETWALVRRCAELDRVETRHPCDDGYRFEISFLPPGRYTLRAAGDGDTQTVTAPASEVALTPPPAPGVTIVDVELHVREFDGTPAGQFSAEARPQWFSQSVESEWVERDGIRVLHVKSNDPCFRVGVTLSDGREAEQSVDAAESTLVEFQLPRVRAEGPCYAIAGTITMGGSPLDWSAGRHGTRGTRVHVSAVREDGSEEASADTRPDGTFSIDGLEGGTYGLWASVRHGCNPRLASAYASACTGRADVVIEMPAAEARSLRCQLPDGFHRIDDFEGGVVGPAGESESAYLCWGDGELVAVGLRANIPYLLWVRVRCGSLWTATAYLESFTAGNEPIDIRLPPGLRIEGTMVRGDGTPVIGAYVYADSDATHSADAYTGLDGSFVLTGLEQGAYSLEITAPGLAKHESVADAGVKGLRLVMQAEH